MLRIIFHRKTQDAIHEATCKAFLIELCMSGKLPEEVGFTIDDAQPLRPRGGNGQEPDLSVLHCRRLRQGCQCIEGDSSFATSITILQLEPYGAIVNAPPEFVIPRVHWFYII